MHHHERLVIEYGNMLEEKHLKLLNKHRDKLTEMDEFTKIDSKQKELCKQRDILKNELAELQKITDQTK